MQTNGRKRDVQEKGQKGEKEVNGPIKTSADSSKNQKYGIL